MHPPIPVTAWLIHVIKRGTSREIQRKIYLTEVAAVENAKRMTNEHQSAFPVAVGPISFFEAERERIAQAIERDVPNGKIYAERIRNGEY